MIDEQLVRRLACIRIDADQGILLIGPADDVSVPFPDPVAEAGYSLGVGKVGNRRFKFFNNGRTDAAKDQRAE